MKIAIIKILILLYLVMLTDLLYAKQDSVSLANYNKDMNFSLGVGNIEFINLAISAHIYKGLYCNLSSGEAFVQGEGFIIPESGSFLKLGLSFRMPEHKICPFITIDAGKAFLHFQESSPTLKISNEAYLISLLGGVEWRYENGFNLGILFGGRYSTRRYYQDQLIYGFQFNLGYRTDM